MKNMFIDNAGLCCSVEHTKTLGITLNKGKAELIYMNLNILR